MGRLCHGAAVVLALLVALPVRAQVSQGDGSKTGDGSTPFTGLAQAPEANLYAGAATTAIALEVPPGRKNLTPKLQLQYSSRGGPSPYGYGWDLPLPRIQRSTKHGVLACNDVQARDEFVLTLGGRNVECALRDGVCEPRIEGGFAKILFVGGTGADNRWEVWDKSGLHYTFGSTGAAAPGPGAALDQPARVGSDVNAAFTAWTKPQLLFGLPGCSYTFSWALTSIEDPNGNRGDFRYLLLDGVLYPYWIEYGGHGTSGGSLDLEHFFRVLFTWEDRPAGDRPADGKGGFAATLTQRLARVQMSYRGAQVRAYEFSYDDERLARQGLLAGVVLYGNDNRALARYDGLTPAARPRAMYSTSTEMVSRISSTVVGASVTRPATDSGRCILAPPPGSLQVLPRGTCPTGR